MCGTSVKLAIADDRHEVHSLLKSAGLRRFATEGINWVVSRLRSRMIGSAVIVDVESASIADIVDTLVAGFGINDGFDACIPGFIGSA